MANSLHDANMFASCKKLLSEDSCASLVPLGKKNVLGGVVCLYCVFLCVFVLIRDVMCCRRCDDNGDTTQNVTCNRRQVAPAGN